MVIHVLLAAKMPILHLFKLTPLLWPFNLRLPLARHLCNVCQAASSTSSLLTFRLRLIVNDGERRLNRWERALRLFWEELLLPLTRRRSDTDSSSSAAAASTASHNEAVVHYFHRRSVLLNDALDASIIQGLLSVSI